MLGRGKRGPRGTRVRFGMEGRRRVVPVEGRDLPEVERERLRRLLRTLPIRSGTIAVSRDWAGRRRLTAHAAQGGGDQVRNRFIRQVALDHGRGRIGASQARHQLLHKEPRDGLVAGGTAVEHQDLGQGERSDWVVEKAEPAPAESGKTRRDRL